MSTQGKIVFDREFATSQIAELLELSRTNGNDEKGLPIYMLSAPAAVVVAGQLAIATRQLGDCVESLGFLAQHVDKELFKSKPKEVKGVPALMALLGSLTKVCHGRCIELLAYAKSSARQSNEDIREEFAKWFDGLPDDQRAETFKIMMKTYNSRRASDDKSPGDA